MKINLVCVGKAGGYLREGIAEYAKRLSRFCEFSIREIPEIPASPANASGAAVEKRKEGAKILEAVRGFAVLTDLAGRSVSSPELAGIIGDRMNAGVSEITFVIGGSNGVSEEVRERADEVVSFGRVTYPHGLMRLILCEQIYRSFAILNNLPYHK